MKLVRPGDLFPTITGQHWRLELAESKRTPNKVSPQIKSAIDSMHHSDALKRNERANHTYPLDRP